jgi:hypothetical protein
VHLVLRPKAKVYRAFTGGDGRTEEPRENGSAIICVQCRKKVDLQSTSIQVNGLLCCESILLQLTESAPSSASTSWCGSVLCSDCEYSVADEVDEAVSLKGHEVGLTRIGQRSSLRKVTTTTINRTAASAFPHDILSQILDFAVSSAKEGGLNYALVSWDWQVALMEQEELWKRLVCSRWPSTADAMRVRMELGSPSGVPRPRRWYQTLFRARALALQSTKVLNPNPTFDPVAIEECGLWFSDSVKGRNSEESSGAPLDDDTVQKKSARSGPPKKSVGNDQGEITKPSAKPAVPPRFAFSYRCPMLLSEMDVLEPGRYFCPGCKKSVYLVDNEESMREKVLNGDCVSFAFSRDYWSAEEAFFGWGAVRIAVMGDNPVWVAMIMVQLSETLREGVPVDQAATVSGGNPTNSNGPCEPKKRRRRPYPKRQFAAVGAPWDIHVLFFDTPCHPCMTRVDTGRARAARDVSRAGCTPCTRCHPCKGGCVTAGS